MLQDEISGVSIFPLVGMHIWRRISSSRFVSKRTLQILMFKIHLVSIGKIANFKV